MRPRNSKAVSDVRLLEAEFGIRQAIKAGEARADQQQDIHPHGFGAIHAARGRGNSWNWAISVSYSCPNAIGLGFEVQNLTP
jgi:hypothetical protein